MTYVLSDSGSSLKCQFQRNIVAKSLSHSHLTSVLLFVLTDAQKGNVIVTTRCSFTWEMGSVTKLIYLKHLFTIYLDFINCFAWVWHQRAKFNLSEDALECTLDGSVSTLTVRNRNTFIKLWHLPWMGWVSNSEEPQWQGNKLPILHCL